MQWIGNGYFSEHVVEGPVVVDAERVDDATVGFGSDAGVHAHRFLAVDGRHFVVRQDATAKVVADGTRRGVGPAQVAQRFGVAHLVDRLETADVGGLATVASDSDGAGTRLGPVPVPAVRLPMAPTVASWQRENRRLSKSNDASNESSGGCFNGILPCFHRHRLQQQQHQGGVGHRVQHQRWFRLDFSQPHDGTVVTLVRWLNTTNAISVEHLSECDTRAPPKRVGGAA